MADEELDLGIRMAMLRVGINPNKIDEVKKIVKRKRKKPTLKRKREVMELQNNLCYDCQATPIHWDFHHYGYIDEDKFLGLCRDCHLTRTVSEAKDAHTKT